MIIEFDGKRINEVQDLRLAAANTPPGRTVNVKVVRYGKVMDYAVTLGERNDQTQTEKGFSFDEKAEPKPEIGMRIDTVPARIARELGITGGALVASVSPGSLAEDAGLRGQQDQAGYFDVIVTANGKNIESYQDMVNILSGLKSGQAVVLKLLRYAITQRVPFPALFTPA